MEAHSSWPLPHYVDLAQELKDPRVLGFRVWGFGFKGLGFEGLRV